MITFEEFKKHVSFSESTDKVGLMVAFRADYCVHTIEHFDLLAFTYNEKSVREFMHDKLARLIYDMFSKEFAQGYTVDDLRLACLRGHDHPYSGDVLFDEVLREIDKRRSCMS